MFSTRKAIVASMAFAAVVWVATPVDAQRGRGGQGDRNSGSQRGGGQARGRSAPPAARESPRQQAPAQRSGQVERQAPPQGSRQVERQAPARTQPQTTVNRGGGGARPRSDYERQGSYQAPRSSNQPRSGSYANRGGSYGRSYAPRTRVFVQPYYTFRPRVTLSFGIRLGYPVSYPYQYYNPYGFYNYRIGVLPGYTAARYTSYYNRIGGLSFDIDPYDAEVFIDGEYVGIADDFSSGQMPLTLVAGRHRVDLQARGFMPVSFDITVVAGQVIPYQGTLPYIR